MTALPQRALDICATLDRLITGRRDVYAIQRKDGGALPVWEPLTQAVWARHVYGEILIGVYPLLQDQTAWKTGWFCIDIDREEHPEEAGEIARVLHTTAVQKFGLAAQIETSRRKGFHLWIFCSAPVEAWKARAVGRSLALECGLDIRSEAKGTGIELFPKQDSLGESDTVGNLVYCPWHGPNVRNGRQAFCNPSTLVPWSDQLAAVSTSQRVHPAIIETIVQKLNLTPSNVKAITQTAPAGKTKKAATAKLADPPPSTRAAPGSIEDLTDKEIESLARKLRSVGNLIKNPTACSYTDWLAALIHLVPFHNGETISRAASASDPKRYNADDFSAKWREAVKIYNRPDRATITPISQLIIEGARAGGRQDIVPITTKHCIWHDCFSKRNWAVTASGAWTENEPTPLSNFWAWITTEDFEDDGTGELRRLVHLAGMMTGGRALPEITIPAEDWPKIRTWVPKHWGAKLTISTGDSCSGAILEVISLMSQEAPEIRSFTHTGWIMWKDRWIFLTNDSVLGLADAETEEFLQHHRLAIPTPLHGYSLGKEPSLEDAIKAYDWIDIILNQGGDPCVLVPLVACGFLAPLSSHLNIDFGLALIGQTGSMKSSAVALLMNMFGRDFDKDHLQASFQSTANFIERLGFHAKDVPFCADNYLPTQQNERIFCRLAHSVGDHAGRGRMRSNQTIAEGKPFRGLLITTGEDFPETAESTAMRMLRVQLHRDRTFHKASLWDAQVAGRRGELVPAMAHYCSWLALQLALPGFIPSIKASFESFWQTSMRSGSHGRVHEQAAWIRVAYQLMESSHPGSMAQETKTLVNEAITKIEQNRVEEVRDFSLARRFLRAVFTLINSGVIRGVDSRSFGVPPVHPGLFGWRGSDETGFDTISPTSAPIIFIEQVHGTWSILMRPDEVVSAIRNFFRTTCPIQESSRAVGAALDAANILLRNQPGRPSSKATIGTERQSCWKLSGDATLNLLSDTSPELEQETSKEDPTPCLQ